MKLAAGRRDPLTKREREVAEKLAQGMAVKEIAAELGLSPKTVHVHRANLLEKLWREGELSTADYLLQLKQTLDTQLAGAELEARLWRSYADYLAATGQLERWAGLEGTP